MPYSNLNNIKLSQGIPLTDSSQDALLSMYLQQSTDIINEWIGRDLTRRTYTEYFRGDGRQYLVLNQRPIHLLQQVCTLNGTTAVTVQDSSRMIVGMPVCGTNPTPINANPNPAIYPGTTVASIIDATHVTLSQAATVSGSQTLFFGVQVWVDVLGYWGSPEDSFAMNTALTPGVDFAIDVDQANGTSRSGLLCSILNVWPIPWNYQPGLITPVLGPQIGNIKVTYTAGYDPVPSSLVAAQNLLVAKMRQVGQYGQQMQSETVKDYSYTLGNQADQAIGLMTPEVTSLLAKFINVAV